MAERLRRAAAWLGLVTDDRYGEYDHHEADADLTENVLTENVEPSQESETSSAAGSWDNAKVTTLESRRIGTEQVRDSGQQIAVGGSSRSVRTSQTAPSPGSGSGSAAASTHQSTHPNTPNATEQRTADLSRIITVHPRTYNEARTIGENFRDGVPVIMNLSDMEDADAKRLVDFAAGLIFGLRGSIERVTSKVFLLCPPNVNVTAEDKERIVGGFFNQS